MSRENGPHPLPPLLCGGEGPLRAAFSELGGRWPSGPRMRCDPIDERSGSAVPGSAATGGRFLRERGVARGLDDGWEPEPGGVGRCPGPHPRRVCRLTSV